jgi:hypothetical protein
MDRGGDRHFRVGETERENGLAIRKDENQALGTDRDELLADLHTAEGLAGAEPAGVGGSGLSAAA